MKREIVTLFAGGGGKTYGAMQAGCTPVGAVEFDAAIAGVYAMNVSPLVTCARVEDVDYQQYAGITGGMASPVCKNASIARAGGCEQDADIVSARATERFIREARPLWFFLENVWGYRKFAAFGIILDALMECGYQFDYQHLNSADFGVPQTRKRLILRAVRVGILPPLPEKVKPWVGWYEAIFDLIPTLPESKFADWQIARLGDVGRRLRGSGLVWGMQNTSRDATVLAPELPCATVIASNKGMPRAFLCSGSDANVFEAEDHAPTRTAAQGKGAIAHRAFLVPADGNESAIAARPGDAPFTILTNAVGRTKAFLVDEAPAQGSLFEIEEPDNSLAWLNYGRVVSMTTRCLARFQSFPDCFKLTGSNELDCTWIGNACPPLLAQRIVEGLVAATEGH